MMKRSNFWNDYPNLESNINSVWDGHKGEVRVSLCKLPNKSFRQTLSFIVFKKILMCRRSSVWESVWNAIYIRVRWIHNHRQLHARQACPLSLSLPRFSLSVSPVRYGELSLVSAHRSEASVLACNNFSCIKTGLTELSKAFWWRSAFTSGENNKLVAHFVTCWMR